MDTIKHTQNLITEAKVIRVFTEYHDSYTSPLMVDKQDYDRIFGKPLNDWEVSQDGEFYILEGEHRMEFLAWASNVVIMLNPAQIYNG